MATMRASTSYNEPESMVRAGPPTSPGSAEGFLFSPGRVLRKWWEGGPLARVAVDVSQGEFTRGTDGRVRPVPIRNVHRTAVGRPRRGAADTQGRRGAGGPRRASRRARRER